MTTSLLLSGLDGMRGLIALWTKYSVGLPSNAPEAMINWRMVGLNLNNLFNLPFGWVVTGLGMGFTIFVVYFLIKNNPPYGSHMWIIAMLGIFSATLAITWHSHYHMAMVLIPFLIYVSINNLLPPKIPFLWVIVTPVITLGFLVVNLVIQLFEKIYFINTLSVIALSGLIVNLIILISTWRISSVSFPKSSQFSDRS